MAGVNRPSGSRRNYASSRADRQSSLAWRGSRFVDAAQVVDREGREYGQGVVTEVPPFDRISVQEVLGEFQGESESEYGDGTPDRLAAGAGEGEEEECGDREGEPVEFAMEGMNGSWPGGLEGADDQEEEPGLGEAED